MNRTGIVTMALLGIAPNCNAQQLNAPPPYAAYEAEGGNFEATRLFQNDVCYAVRRREQLLNSSAPKNYERQQHVLKADIVCIADAIVVDEPIYTNGGDIFIFASQLTISAPIDTRIHLEQFPAAPYLEPPRETPHPRTREPIRNVFRAYYTDCAPCEATSVTKLAPRLPSGLIGKKMFVWPPKPDEIGTAPPDEAVNFDVARSGSIYLAVNSLTFGDDSTDPARVKTLQVGGLSGGRGGPGATAQCAGRGPCDYKGYVNSGVSGPGGRGGAAGSILLMMSGLSSPDATSAAVRFNADIAGGAAGPNERRRTPFAPDGLQIVVPREQWKVISPEWPVAEAGAPGDVTVIQPPVQDTLGELRRFVGTVDGNATLDVADLYYRAARDESLRYSTMSGFVLHRLTQAALDAEARIARDLEAEAGGQQHPSEAPLWPSLRGVSASELGDYSAPERQVLLLLSTLDIPAGSGVSGYFTRNGGAFAIRNRDIYTRYWQDALRVDVARQLELSAKLMAELADVSRLTLYQVTTEGRRNLQLDLEKALSSLRVAEAQARSSKGSRLHRLADSINSAAGPITVFAGALATDNVTAAASSAPAAARSLRDVQSALLGSKWHPDSTTALRDAVANAQQSLMKFDEDALLARESVLQRVSSAQREVLRNREAVQARVDGRAFLIPDMLRHVLVTHAIDATRDPGALRSNTLAVQVLATTTPTREPNSDFMQNPKVCTQGPAETPVAQDCIAVPVSDTWQTVYGSFGAPTHLRVPLYVVAPGTGPFAFPTYGVPNTEVEQSNGGKLLDFLSASIAVQ